MSEQALAYFITFRTYGTWLHGDDRGSSDRNHRAWDEPHVAPDAERRNIAYSRLATRPVTFDREQRRVVGNEIQRQCQHRDWILHAVNVRTEHVHVVSAPQRPEVMMNILKSYATRALRQLGRWEQPSGPWSRHGSTRYLWTERDVAGACVYVNEMQDSPTEAGR
jgi:REP element-mobilizing transposase RayT